MKWSKHIIMAFAATIATSAALADNGVGKIYDAGLATLRAVETRGIQAPENPVICVAEKGRIRVLIYSHDFRFKDALVTLVDGDLVSQLAPTTAQIVEAGDERRSENGEIAQSKITMRGDSFICERQVIQLE